MGRFFTVLFLFLSTAGFSFQNKLDDDKIRFGISTNYIGNLNFYAADGFIFNTSIDARINNHILSISPLFFIDKNNETSFLRGSSLSYKYFPGKQNKHLNFFLIADIMYTFDKINWSKYSQFSTDVVFYNIDYESRWNSMKALVGYGLQYNITEKFHISTNMSLGVDFYNYSNKTTVKENPNYSNEYKSGSIFNNSKITSIFKIGIGYEF